MIRKSILSLAVLVGISNPVHAEEYPSGTEIRVVAAIHLNHIFAKMCYQSREYRQLKHVTMDDYVKSVNAMNEIDEVMIRDYGQAVADEVYNDLWDGAQRAVNRSGGAPLEVAEMFQAIGTNPESWLTTGQFLVGLQGKSWAEIMTNGNDDLQNELCSMVKVQIAAVDAALFE